MQYLSTIQKCTAYILLLSQLFLPVSVTFSSVAYATEQEKILSNELPKYKYGSYSYLPTLGSSETSDNNTNTESQFAQGASQFGQILSNDNATESSINYVRSLGESLINQKVNDWLNQYGKARVQLTTKKTADVDFLAPFFDSENSLLFSQFGVRATNDRNTLNFGIGYRQEKDNWMWGINSFYDYDMTGRNSRLGIGAELWFDYFKLAGNGYFRLTDWHQSKLGEMSDYDERPANGFDIRVEGYLPSYPQLGAYTKYEQYFGENVNLSDSAVSKTDLKNNPTKATLGLSYTPFPLMTLKGEKSYGDSNEAKIGIDLEYRFGVPLSEQLDPNFVSIMRSLKGNRYDFVDRNYNIVMQYRQQELINISLPQSLNAKSQETITVTATVNKSKYGLKSIVWSAPELINDGGNIIVTTPTSITLTAPKHITSAETQKYKLTAVAEDNQGNTSRAVVTWVTIEPSAASIKSIDFDMNGTVAANGEDGYDAAVVVQNEDGTPVANEDVLFEISGFSDNNQVTLTLVDGDAVSRNVRLRSATLSSGVSGQGSLHVLTNAQGKASINISSTVMGEGKLSVSVNDGEKTTKAIRFVADNSTAKIDSLTADKTSVVADGVSTNTLTVKVLDAKGNVVSGQNMTLTAGSGLTLSATELTSGSDGLATFTVKSTTAGTFDVTAKLKDVDDAAYVTISIIFTAGDADVTTSSLSASPTSIVANGMSTSLITLTLKDANSNVVSGQTGVKFETALSGVTFSDVTDNKDGTYNATLTAGTTAGVANISVKLGEMVFTVASTSITLTAGSVDATKSTLSASPVSIVADGKVMSTITLTLKDTNNNLVSGQTGIKFETALSGTTISDVNDNNDGTYTATLKGTTAGTADISVKFGEAIFEVASVSVTLKADNADATNSTLIVSPTAIVADEKATSVVTLTLKDTNGNLVLNRSDIKFENTSTLITLSSVTNNEDGTYSATLTSGKTAGTASISVKFGETAFAVTSASVTLTAGSAVTTKSSLAVSPASIVADGSATSTVTLTLKDTNGNLVSNQSGVKFETTNSTVTLGDVTNNGDGTYSATLTSGKIAGTASISVKLGETAFLVDSVNVTLTAGNADTTKSTLEASPTTIVANDTATSTITLSLKDINDNIVADASVGFTTSLPAITFSATVNNNDGTYTSTIKGKTAGVAQVKAVVNSQSFAVTPASVTLTANTSTAKVDTLTAENASVIADGETTNTVTVKVVDANGNILSDQVVSVTADTAVTLSASEVTSGSDGLATFTVKSTTAGSFNVSAKVKGKDDSDKVSLSVVFVSGSAVATKSSLSISPTSIVANDTDIANITLTLKDTNGNLVAGQSNVKFSSPFANTTISETTDMGGGTYTATIKGKTAGSAAVNVKFDEADFAVASASVTLTADSSTAQLGNLTVDVNNAVADDVDVNKLTVTVIDANGNLLSNQYVALSATNGATVQVKGVITREDGSASFDVYSTKSGDSVITATFKGKTKEVTIHFIAGDADDEMSSFTASKSSIVADNQTVSKLTLTLKDENDNVVIGQKGVKFKTSLSGVTFSEVTDNSDGTYTANFSGTTAGRATVNVTLNEIDFAVTAVNITLTADSTTAKVSSLTADKKSVVADGTSVNTITVKVVDANNNTLNGQDVTLTAGSGLTLSATEVTSGSNGLVTLTVKSTTAGSFDVSAKIKDAEDSTNVTLSVVFVAGSAVVANSLLSTSPTSIVADGSATSTITLTLKDTNNNLVSDQTGIKFETKLPGVTISDVTDNNNGIYTATLTAGTTAGTADINVKINDVGFGVNTATITLTAGSADINKSSLSVSPESIVADGKAISTITLTLKDKNGNLVAGQKGVKFETTFSDVTIGQVTDNNGTYSANMVAGTTVGKADIKVKFDEIAFSVSEVSVNLTASNADSEKSTLSASEMSIESNGSATSVITLTLKDVNGNVIPDQTGVTFETTLFGVTISKVTNNKDGTYTSTLTAGTTSGIAEIFVKFDDTTFKVASLSITLLAGSADAAKSSLRISSSPIVADGKATSTVTLTLKDANGNLVSNQSDVKFKTTNSTVTLGSVTNKGDGTYSATLTSGKISGTASISVKFGETDFAVTPVRVDLVASDADKDKSLLVVSPTSIVADGRATSTVTLTLKDANDNPVLGQTVTFTNSLSNVTIGKTTDVGDGTYTAELTGTTMGINEVKAMLGGKSFALTSVNVTLTADSSTAVISSLTIEANNAAADGETKNQVKVVVLDANSNPVSDQAVTFTAGNSATLSASEVKTGSDGSAIVTLTSNTKGGSIVTATLKGKTSTKSVRTNFVTSISLDNTTITAGTSTLSADSTSSTEITLFLKDEDGDGIASQAVKAKSSLTTTTISTATDLGDGRYTFVLTSGRRIGDSKISFTVNGVSINKSTIVTFIADANSAGLTNSGAGLFAETNDAIANGIEKNTIKAVVTDKNGNPLSKIAVSFSSTTGGVNIATGSVITDSDGTASTNVTSTKSGAITMTAIVAGVSYTTSLNFTADSATSKMSDTYRLVKNNVAADGVQTGEVKFYVIDTNNNPLSDIAVSLSVTGDASLKSSSLKSTTDGSVTAQITSTKSGRSIVVATVGDSSVQANVSFIADSSTVSLNNTGSSLSIISDGVFSDGVYFSRAKVVLVDANGNLASNATVSLSVNSTDATLPSSVTTGGDGTATFKVQSTKSGSYTVTATINSSSKTATVNFVDNVNTSLSTIVLNPQSITMGQTSTATITLYNNDGELIKNATVLVYSALGSAGKLTITEQTNNNDGTYTALLTPNQTGSTSIGASVNGSNVGITNQTLTVNADNSTASFDNSGSSVSLYSNYPAAADGINSNIISIVLADNQGQPVSGETISLSLSNGAYFSSGLATQTATSGSTDKQNGIYRVSVYSKTEGFAVLTATYNGTSKAVTIRFLTAADITQSTVSTDKTVVQVGSTATVSTQLRDSSGNKITSQGQYTVNCYSSLASSTAIAANYNSSTTTFDCSVGSSKSGVATVSIMVNGKTLANTANITFTGSTATAKLVSIEAPANNAVANGSASNQVKVTVQDTSGHTVSGVSVNFTATNGATISSTGITGSDGTIVMNVVSTKSGTSTVTASLTNTTGGISSQTQSVTFKADTSTASLTNSGAGVSVLVNNAYANGTDNNTLRIIVTDSNGNVVPDVTLSFKATNGATIPSSGVTSSEGILDIALTSTSLGNSTVITTLNNSSITKEVTFTKVYSDTLSTLTGSATEISADGLDTSTVTLLLKDNNGTLDANADISFVSSLKGVVLSNQTNLGEGKYTVDVTSQVAGKTNISVMINNAVRNITPVAITIKGVDSDASVTNTGAGIVIETDDANADGTSVNTLTVTVTDKSGNAIAGKSVALSGTNGVKFSNSLSAINLTTDSEGKISFDVTSIYGGTSRITATLNGSVSTDINFNRAFSDELSVLKLTSASILADGQASTTVTWEPKDYSGASFAALDNVSFSLSDGQYVVLSAVSEKTNGSYSATISSTKAKVITISPAVNSAVIGNNTVSVEFKPLTINKIYSLDDTSTKISFDASSGTVNGYPTIGWHSQWNGTSSTSWNADVAVKLYFTGGNGSDLSNSAYTWSSNQSWAKVENGIVTFTSKPTSSNRTVTIKATYPGYDDYTYTFTISKWFTVLYGFNVYPSVNAECVKTGGTIPSIADVVTSSAQKGVKGTLYGEHGVISSGGYWHWLSDSSESGIRSTYNKNGKTSTASEVSTNYKLCMYDL